MLQINTEICDNLKVDNIVRDCYTQEELEEPYRRRVAESENTTRRWKEYFLCDGVTICLYVHGPLTGPTVHPPG
jgi:hypothetical protein